MGGNLNPTAIKDKFDELIAEVTRKMVGFQDFGSTVEFYDEDGVVLLVITKDNGKCSFTFGTDDLFDFDCENEGVEIGPSEDFVGFFEGHEEGAEAAYLTTI